MNPHRLIVRATTLIDPGARPPGSDPDSRARLHASVERALRTAWNLHSKVGACTGTPGPFARGRASRCRGVHRQGAARDAGRAAAGLDGTAVAQPQLRGRALHAQREALARRADDPALGGQCATGGQTALPPAARLPRHAPPGQRPRRVGAIRRRHRTGGVCRRVNRRKESVIREIQQPAGHSLRPRCTA